MIEAEPAFRHLTAVNAARCLLAFASPSTAARVPILPGARQPLLRPAKHDAEIHGVDGLGGVEGLPAADSREVRAKLAGTGGGNVVGAMAEAARGLGDGERLTIVATGTLTNVALFLSVSLGGREAVLVGWNLAS